MPNRLELPDDLDKLIEKREGDRRQADAVTPPAAQPTAEQIAADVESEERRQSGRRTEDQNVSREID